MFHLKKISRRFICYARINSIYHKKIKSEICKVFLESEMIFDRETNKTYTIEICKVCLGSGLILDRETNKSYTCFACNDIGVVNKF